MTPESCTADIDCGSLLAVLIYYTCLVSGDMTSNLWSMCSELKKNNPICWQHTGKLKFCLFQNCFSFYAVKLVSVEKLKSSSLNDKIFNHESKL